MKLGGGFCQDILDHTLSEFSGTLVLPEDDPDLQAGLDFSAVEGAFYGCPQSHYGKLQGNDQSSNKSQIPRSACGKTTA